MGLRPAASWIFKQQAPGASPGAAVMSRLFAATGVPRAGALRLSGALGVAPVAQIAYAQSMGAEIRVAVIFRIVYIPHPEKPAPGCGQ